MTHTVRFDKFFLTLPGFSLGFRKSIFLSNHARYKKTKDSFGKPILYPICPCIHLKVNNTVIFEIIWGKELKMEGSVSPKAFHGGQKKSKLYGKT